MIHFSFSLSLFSVQFLFLSSRTALQIILSFHLILIKILPHVCNFHLLTYHCCRCVSHNLGLDYQQGYTRPFYLWCSTQRGRSHSSILPQFLLIHLPPGWTVYQHVGFLKASQQDLLWISWDHQSCCDILGYHPPLFHTPPQ